MMTIEEKREKQRKATREYMRRQREEKKLAAMEYELDSSPDAPVQTDGLITLDIPSDAFKSVEGAKAIDCDTLKRIALEQGYEIADLPTSEYFLINSHGSLIISE